MKRTVLNVIQGTHEWNAARASADGTASEYPAAAGKSKYQPRTELLDQRKHGISNSVDARTQALFDKGHAAEAGARPIAEELIGDELSPTTMLLEIDGLKLLASLDGITFDDEIIFEHKLWNESLADSIENDEIPENYTLQMDQQLLVSDAKKCLFMTSDGTKENNVWCWYETTEEKKAAVIATWRQFHKDLANHTPKEIVEPPKAEAIMALPALSVQIRGEVIATNLPEFKAAAVAFIESINTDLKTDEDFALAKANVKFCKDAEEELEVSKKAAIAQTSSIDELMRTVDHISALLRDKRLMLDKLVKSQEELIKAGIVADARKKFDSVLVGLESEIKPIRLNYVPPAFSEAIKNKRTLASLHDAVNTELARATIELEAIAKDVRGKLSWCKTNAEGYGFLFSDLQQIIGKPLDDFTLLVTSRIDSHKKDEAERISKIEAEAKEKAETELLSKQQQNTHGEDAPSQAMSTGDGGAAPLNPAPAANEPVVDLHKAVVDSRDDISAFMASREFGKDANKIRTALVEFVKFTAQRNLSKAA